VRFQELARWDAQLIKQEIQFVPAIFDLLYREYCRARLAEMRNQLLIPRTESQEVPEANCDATHPDGAADRGSGLDDGQCEANESLFGHGASISGRRNDGGDCRIAFH
jgi:hypothetical protein